MPLRKLLMPNSCHSQTQDPWKVRGTEVMVAFSLSNIYCILGLLTSTLFSNPLWLVQWPIYLLGLSWGLQWGRQIFQPKYLLLWVGMQCLYPHLQLNPLPLNIFHRKELPYLGLSPLLQCVQSKHHAAYLPQGVPSRNENVGHCPQFCCLSHKYL